MLFFQIALEDSHQILKSFYTVNLLISKLVAVEPAFFLVEE